MRKVISATFAAVILLASVTVAETRENSVPSQESRAQESRAQESRAQELIEQARAALGGDKLKSIQSLSVSGKYRRILQPDTPEMAGEMEIDFLLPDKYLKTETMNLPVGDGYITRIDGINGDQAFRDSKTSGGGGMVIIRRPGSDGPEGQAAEARASFTIGSARRSSSRHCASTARASARSWSQAPASRTPSAGGRR